MIPVVVSHWQFCYKNNMICEKIRTFTQEAPVFTQRGVIIMIFPEVIKP